MYDVIIVGAGICGTSLARETVQIPVVRLLPGTGK